MKTMVMLGMLGLASLLFVSTGSEAAEKELPTVQAAPDSEDPELDEQYQGVDVNSTPPAPADFDASRSSTTTPPKDRAAGSMSTEPAAALAAAPCRKRADGKWTCFNRVPARIYDSAYRVIDNLRTNPSWFVCRAEGGYSGGGSHPNRWVWTQGDDVGRWGWVRDIDIASETDPIRSCF